MVNLAPFSQLGLSACALVTDFKNSRSFPRESPPVPVRIIFLVDVKFTQSSTLKNRGML